GGNRDGAVALNRERTAGERRLHAFPDPSRLDWQILVDASDHRAECGGIEPRKLAILDAKEALALQRSDEGGRASAATLDLAIQVQPAGYRRAIAGQQRGHVRLRQPDTTPYAEFVAVAFEREPAGNAAAGNVGLEILKADVRRTKIQHAVQIFRDQMRRQHG